ncbi:MAG: hydrogenase maturation nickel metallochaperone HypA [Bacillota bacterium]|nr:hydrogenase maturation nickel metallochaperone HypA [Bacillota bacterium]
MHELPITQSIVRIVCDEAERNNLKKITEVRLKVGELSGLVPDCIQYYFDIISENTIAKGAVVKVEKIPLKMKCKSCGFTAKLDMFKENKCIKCGGNELTRVSGNELYIDSIDAE